MFRLIVPVTICLAGPLSGQNMDCRMGACQQVLACIGDEGLWFKGETNSPGPLNNIAGMLNDGSLCTGERMQFNKYLAGSVTLNCTNGIRAVINYDEPPPRLANGYGTGRATADDGRAVQVWVGDDLIAALRQETGETGSLLPCPGGAVRLD